MATTAIDVRRPADRSGRSLEIEDAGIIFRNPLPGHRVINAFYPEALRLPDGEWLCAIRTGGALYSPDGMVELFRSSNDGATWLRQGPLVDRTCDPIAYSYYSGHLTLLRDGSLVVRVTRADQRDPDRLVYNPVTQGLINWETCFMRSSDGGRSWTEPTVGDLGVSFASTVCPTPLGNTVELDDGSWMQIFDSWKSYENDGPNDLNPYALFSQDQGRTWGERVAVAGTAGAERSFSHGLPIRLRSGRLLLSCWTAEPDLQTSHDLHTFTSLDRDGRAWGPPQATGIPGQTSCAAVVGGELLMIFSHREGTEQPGIKVVMSSDGGQTWSLDQPLIVWDAYGREALGVPRTATYPSSHDAIAYGAPRITMIDERRALAVFWCTLGADTHCRWARIRIT